MGMDVHFGGDGIHQVSNCKADITVSMLFTLDNQ